MPEVTSKSSYSFSTGKINWQCACENGLVHSLDPGTKNYKCPYGCGATYTPASSPASASDTAAAAISTSTVPDRSQPSQEQSTASTAARVISVGDGAQGGNQ